MVMDIFKKKTKDVKSEKNLVLICALFVHAAKMDENYTDKEQSIILKALSDFSDKVSNISKLSKIFMNLFYFYLYLSKIWILDKSKP